MGRLQRHESHPLPGLRRKSRGNVHLQGGQYADLGIAPGTHSRLYNKQAHVKTATYEAANHRREIVCYTQKNKSKNERKDDS